MQKLIQTTIIAGCLYLTACSQVPFLYRPTVQQGNVITDSMLSTVKPGMSGEQVRYLMGNPVLINTFDNDTLNYVYTLQPSKGAFRSKKVIMHFAHDRLVRVEK